LGKLKGRGDGEVKRGDGRIYGGWGRRGKRELRDIGERDGRFIFVPVMGDVMGRGRESRRGFNVEEDRQVIRGVVVDYLGGYFVWVVGGDGKVEDVRRVHAVAFRDVSVFRGGVERGS
jgi:hypothetical protein